MMIAGGLALTGMRPYLHSYAPFAVDRRVPGAEFVVGDAHPRIFADG